MLSAAHQFADAADGWTPLFNGKDLGGWKTDPKQAGQWKVENDAIISSGNGISHLSRKQPMRRHATSLGLTLVIAALSMNVAAGQESPQKKQAATAENPLPKNQAVINLLKTQLQAAKKAQVAAVGKMQVKQVGGTLVLVNSNHPNPEEAYTWSLRWLHAQRDLSETKEERMAAFADHHTRMKELRVMVTTLVGDGKGGLMTPADAAVAAPAAAWYLAEAELWLLTERGK